MSTAFPTTWHLGDLQEHLGGIPLERIRLHPLPGLATEEDMLRLSDHEGILCELIDGVLVEKGMGSYESAVAIILSHYLASYLEQNPLGFLLGADGMLKLRPGRIRIPDVSFLSWNQFPGRKRPKAAVWSLVPDLAVEVLSESNTDREIEMKLDEYFASGTSLAWIIDPENKTAKMYSSRNPFTEIDAQGTLLGDPLLPGFSLPMRKLFDALPE